MTVRRPLTESPWYWVYLFCTAGLVALILAGPKFAARQSQIERKAQGRQRAAQNVSGKQPVTPLSDEEHTQISLRPLYYVLGGILFVAWSQLIWRQCFRRTMVPIVPDHSDPNRQDNCPTEVNCSAGSEGKSFDRNN